MRWLAHPIPAWTLFNVDMVLWHIPKFYNLTLEHQWIHDCEHTLFFFTGLLFWAHIVDPGPIRARLAWPARTAYVIGAMVVGWMLAIALVLYPTPLYPHYADLLHRLGRALSDRGPAGSRRHDVGLRLDLVHDHRDLRVLALGRAGQARNRPGRVGGDLTTLLHTPAT